MTAWIILLFGLGLLLILAEVLIPSMGILGVTATICLVGAIGWGFAEDATVGTYLLVGAAVLVPIVLTVGLRLFPKSPIGRKLTARGYTFEDGVVVDARDRDLVGRTGEVVSPLRPAGMARIEGRRVDVVSRGELIEAGAPVVVVEVAGSRVIVARRDDAVSSA